MLCLAIGSLANIARGEEFFGLCLGGGGVVEAPAPKLPADGKQLCVEFRFKALATMGPAMRLVSQWTDDPKAADACAFHFDLLAQNRLAFTLRVGKGRSETITGKETWIPQSWHHAAATWNGSDVALYLDGKLVSAHRIDGAKLATSALPLTIGQPGPPGKPMHDPATFKGFVGDVAIWAASPSAEAIAERAGKAINAADPGLAAYLALREAAPAEVVKEAVSGQDVKIAPGLAPSAAAISS